MIDEFSRILRPNGIQLAFVMLPYDLNLSFLKRRLLLHKLKLWQLWLLFKLAAKNVILELGYRGKFYRVVRWALLLFYDLVLLNKVFSLLLVRL